MTIREAIESMYEDRCDVINLVNVKNEENRRTEQVAQTVYSDVPCKLSIKNLSSTSDTTVNSTTASAALQISTVFMAPELDIKPGSKFVIKHRGRTFKYESSGYPAIYEDHQEIRLEWSDWA